jgi:translation initiation factor 1 (eIF-1/SUI1)
MIGQKLFLCPRIIRWKRKRVRVTDQSSAKAKNVTIIQGAPDAPPFLSVPNILLYTSSP